MEPMKRYLSHKENHINQNEPKFDGHNYLNLSSIKHFIFIKLLSHELLNPKSFWRGAVCLLHMGYENGF